MYHALHAAPSPFLLLLAMGVICTHWKTLAVLCVRSGERKGVRACCLHQPQHAVTQREAPSCNTPWVCFSIVSSTINTKYGWTAITGSTVADMRITQLFARESILTPCNPRPILTRTRLGMAGEQPGAEMAFVQVASGVFQMRASQVLAPLVHQEGEGMESPEEGVRGQEGETRLSFAFLREMIPPIARRR